MYQIDEKDRVRELLEAPRPDGGAPLPVVLASDDSLHLVYRVNNPDPNWDSGSVREVSPTTAGEKLAVVRFPGIVAHYFGMPNDEAFSGHPLAARGLRPYAVWEVEKSSWIRGLERINAVHPNHNPAAYRSLRHVIFGFHDTTFECVSQQLDWTIVSGSVKSVLERCVASLS